MESIVKKENKSNPQQACIKCDHSDVITSADKAIEIIRSAYDRISSEFSDYLPECENFKNCDSDLQEIGYTISRFNETVSTEIPVCIIGTYSVGKSTLINAIVGDEILPSAVRQCTAKNVKVINNDECSIAIDCSGEKIKFYVRIGEIIPDNCSEESDEIFAALHDLIDFTGKDEASLIREILRVLNREIESNLAEKIGFNVIISCPFKGSILNNGTAKIVLYDTPGSDNSDNSQCDHLEALKELMHDQTNALPVFIMDREHALANDHNDVKDLIDNYKEGFSSPNCIIVFSKAERLTKQQLGESIPPILCNWHGGVAILYACAIGALGAKKGGNKILDPEAYKDWQRKFHDDKRILPDYNAVPCGRKMDKATKESVSNELYATGIPSLEDEINYYVLRYANYKKCVSGRKLLFNAMNMAAEKLKSDKVQLSKTKNNKEIEQDRKRYQLIEAIRNQSIEEVEIYSIANKYKPHLDAYCSTVYETVKKIGEEAQAHDNYIDYMNEALKKDCIEKLFIPSYEGENGIAHQIVLMMTENATRYISSLKQIVEGSRDYLTEKTKDEIDEVFNDIGTPKFELVSIKKGLKSLNISKQFKFKWLEERSLKSITDEICTKLDNHNGGFLKQKKYFGEFQKLCIINPKDEYEKQLLEWIKEKRESVERTINRDNAILSQYDKEIAEAESRIQDLEDRLDRLEDVRVQLEKIFPLPEKDG